MGSGDRSRQPTHIQIEDMGDVTNLTDINQNATKASHTRGTGDPSRLGGHVTRTTEYTSNVGGLSMTHDGGLGAADRAVSAIATGPLSANFAKPGSVTPSAAGDGGAQSIINYPYSYD